jgi:hypothetical protein
MFHSAGDFGEGRENCGHWSRVQSRSGDAYDRNSPCFDHGAF